MQQIFAKLSGLTLLCAVLFLAGCTDDGPIDNPNVLGPEIFFNSGSGLISADTDLFPGTSFTVSVTVDDGDNPLEVLTVTENGSNVPAANLTFDAGAVTAQNPFLIVGADANGTTYDITVEPTRSEEGDYVYEFTVTDTEGRSESVSLTINYEGTPIEMTITGVLLNQAGPAGQGGVDLDTGASVGSDDADAELQDEGINLDLPPANNWRRQISGANDAVVRTPDMSALPENFSWENVSTREEIVAAFDSGKALDGDDSLSAGSATDDIANEEVSEPVEAGDLFVVFRNGRYYLVRVDAVRATDGNNMDQYELSIKY